MLVICEDCAKKYHIDENRIKGQRAKFACKACGHIIVVEKSEQSEGLPLFPTANSDGIATSKDDNKIAAKQQADRKAAAEAVGAAAAKGRGKPFILPLFAVLIIGFLAIGGSFLFLYLRHVPTLIVQESELRSLAVALSLEQVIKVPLLRKDYLLINQETKRTAMLPGVAYAAVVNEKGTVVAGFFNAQAGFDNNFLQKIQEKGFPVDVLAQNGLKAGAKEGNVQVSMGGLQIVDRVLALTEGDGEVHVGIPTHAADQVIGQALLSPLVLIPAGIALLFAGLILVLVDWLIVRPARSLTNTANRISLGELDLTISTDGSREMRDLATALERMRHSVRIAVERLTTKPH